MGSLLGGSRNLLNLGGSVGSVGMPHTGSEQGSQSKAQSSEPLQQLDQVACLSCCRNLVIAPRWHDDACAPQQAYAARRWTAPVDGCVENRNAPGSVGMRQAGSGKLINPVLTGLDGAETAGAETAGVSECNSPTTLNQEFFKVQMTFGDSRAGWCIRSPEREPTVLRGAFLQQDAIPFFQCRLSSSWFV